MNIIPRDQFINQLNNNWKPYVSCFQQLSPEDRSCFLQKQGYVRFADLLAHIIAWWQDGTEVIRQMQQDPGFPLLDYDVDDFNARAVKKFAGMDEATVMKTFETQRLVMLDTATSLLDQQLYQENINTRLYYEVIFHWTEHPLDVQIATQSTIE